jgi:hypothetical protein
VERTRRAAQVACTYRRVEPPDIDDLLVVGLPGAVGAIAFGYVLHDVTSDLKAKADRMVKRLGAATNTSCGHSSTRSSPGKSRCGHTG